uniref:Histamine N-methyltransferase n=1 Tax=Oncorhynchus tshawytscha TaxID=74940 RepID=A0A8C8EX04_ONCTS
MSCAMKSLVEDNDRYLKSFQLFLERSSEHKCMQDFIHGILPDILASVGEGKANLNVMGVGSGAGEIDLEMFSQLHLKHPAVTVDNQVVEPSAQQLHLYKVLDQDCTQCSRDFSPLLHTDLLQILQVSGLMLYYVKDPGATVTFYQSLLDRNGKLLVILVSDESGWGKLWRTFRTQLCNTEISQCVTTGDIKAYLDSKTVSYQSYKLPSQMDITECFTEGDQRGELLLDFLTEVLDFSSTAPPELKRGVLDLLKTPDCSKEVDGRVIFNNTLEVLVVDPLQ